jgi:hypothetical protein
MASSERFGELARRAYLSYHQDGLVDILAGGILLGLALGMRSTWFGPSALWPAVLVGLIYLGLKEWVVIPRVGYAEFRRDPRRESLLRIVYPVVVCAFMLGVLLVGDIPPGETPVAPVWLPSREWPGLKLWMADKPLLVLGFTALGLFGLIALGTGLRRMVAYAGLGLLLGVAGHIAGVDPYLPVLALDGIILLVGVVVFVRFLRRHPRRRDEDPAIAGDSWHAG